MSVYLTINTLNVTVPCSPTAVLKNKITLLCRKGLSVNSLLSSQTVTGYVGSRANIVGAESLVCCAGEALLRSSGP